MSYPTGFFHMDIAEVHTGEGKLYLFVAIDRTSKFAVARLWDGQVLEPSTISNLDYTVDVGVTLVSTDNGNVFSLWGSEHDLIVKGSVSGGTAIHFGDEIGDTGNRLVVSSMADVRGATRGVSFQSLGRRFSTTATSGAARACMSRVQGEITSNGQIRSSSYLSTGAANDVATNRGATIRDVPLGVGNDVSEDVGGVAR